MQPSSIKDGPVKKAPVALQLWTVREEARRDFAGTLRQAAALGYAGVEHVHSLGYGGLSARQVRAMMDDLGLRTAGCHVELTEWEADLDRIVAYQCDLGTRHVAVSWVPPERRRDEAAYLQMADSLRGIAARCRDQGMQLVYHHHDYEFVRFGGQYALDLLLEADGRPPASAPSCFRSRWTCTGWRAEARGRRTDTTRSLTCARWASAVRWCISRT
jgi:sugar phosphate isomerase/epimerase